MYSIFSTTGRDTKLRICHQKQKDSYALNDPPAIIMLIFFDIINIKLKAGNLQNKTYDMGW